uniref:FAD-binding domain-containing protein n=1 Tax=Attheya septentrionalis TaxID=420275 RepID=A0A7S2U7R1_9STRA|mmetsp:Transcript_14076/g.25437  ORF Transcript_14076/g.25437 Transcript_14076/m.25437 type:complete len:456 (+) Transcript_14076:76-1443(+)
MGMKRVVVVGGGPAGAATAKALADKGCDVQLFEAYPHPDKIHKNAPKAYVIALGQRGQDGLQRSTGIDPLQIPNSIVSTHMVRHPKNNVRKHDKTPSLIIPRKVLAAQVLDAAKAAGVQINFEYRLMDIKFDQQIAIFEGHGGVVTKHVPYDLLVGADGSKSKVRSLLNQNVNEFKVMRTEEDSMEYQVAVIPPPFPFSGMPETSVHAWNDKKYNSICLAFPLANNGGLLFAIVYPEGKLSEFKEKHRIDGTGYDDPLFHLMPDLTDVVKEEFVKQLEAGEPANGGTCVWCNSLGSPKHGVALVGDSGHGMWPSLGQGANCALESAAVFSETVGDIVAGKVTLAGKSWGEVVVEEFNKRRHADALAAVDLTYGGIGARKSRGRNNAPLSYKAQVVGMMLLNKLTLGIVPKPALIRLMMGQPVPYSTARKWNFIYEKLVCLGAVLMITVALVLYKF